MKIENNIIKEYLKNVYFITGTAYAGKSTMVSMLAKRYQLIERNENYHMAMSDKVSDVKRQPNISYFKTMKSWQEFIKRTPEDYDNWLIGSAKEAAEFEVAELIRISANQKVIVDTNIPVELLHEISDYDHVAIMVSPQSMSVEHFFDRPDPEKQFIKQQIEESDDPIHVMENYKKCLAKVNSIEHYNEYANSGFFVIKRENVEVDTKEEVLSTLAQHFRYFK